MHSFILQDWITIRGATATTTVTQGESGWLDLTPYQDLIFWLDTREVTGAVTITFQTALTKDESLFTLITTGTALVAATTPTIIKALLTTGGTPVARFCRWTLTGPASVWDASFRVYVAANSPGT